MPTYFCVTVRFLQPVSHGRGDGGRPEWPPSPLRLFQSLVAASAARWNERINLQHALPALFWLERQHPPKLIAAGTQPAKAKYRLYVPDNVGDKVAASWSRGGAASIADYRVAKDVHLTRLNGETVHYLYQIDEADLQFPEHEDTLIAAARSITHLGWGVDMVVAGAGTICEKEATNLSGDQWQPSNSMSGNVLRVPQSGTLKALLEQHAGFLARVTPDGFKPASPLTQFRIIGYHRATDPVQRLFVAFGFLKADASGFRAFDTARQSLTVAGMLRYATKQMAERTGWSRESVDICVLGHGEPRGAAHVPVGPKRFAYLPLPSIEFRGSNKTPVVGSVRRAIMTVFTEGCEREIAWARRTLSGQELIEQTQKQATALLSLIPSGDTVVRCYTRVSADWATVTPLVLPGYDDPRHYRRRLKHETSAQDQSNLLNRLHDRVDALLRKSIIQAGFPEIMADCAEIEWRNVGFWPGTELADRYGVPNHLMRFPRLHVRIQWRDRNRRPIEIPGPLCLGGGRFCGLGLFAAC